MAAQAAQEPITEFLLQYVNARDWRTSSYWEVGYHLPHRIVFPNQRRLIISTHPKEVPDFRMPSTSMTTRARKPDHTIRHTAVCTDCNASTSVPFLPRPDRPVYCGPCFQSRRHSPRAAAKTPVNEPVTEYESRDDIATAVDSVFPGMALKAATRQAIARMDISEPTPIQEKSIPHLLEGRDLIGQARTGSGKTLAFAVPMVEQCDPSVRKIQALVLVPTRELAIQVAKVTAALASTRRLRVTLLYGGRSLRPEHTALKNGVHIVIGTPGRTLDHVRQGTLDLRSVRFMVLDEADEMLDRGFAHDVEAILGKTPSGRQTALMSATMPGWVAKTAAKHLKDPVTVEVDSDLQSLPTVDHLVYTIRKSDKIEVLQDLLNERRGALVIVFGKTKHGVMKLAKQLDGMGYPVGALQGNLSQNARERVMKDFRSGDTPILVATNVAARGLDVEGIEQVINYDLPDTKLLFTHRVGRTGRMGRSGEAVTLITSDEERKWREIERGLGRHFKRMPWSVARQQAQLQKSYA